MDTSYLREKANCLRNEMNHIWGAIFIMGGGAIGFSIIAEKTLLIYFYIIAGFFLTIVFFNAYFTKRTELTKILNKLKKGEI